jgi:hypothetical protein
VEQLHEEMHAFSQEPLAQAEPGSGVGALTAKAHIERWLDVRRRSAPSSDRFEDALLPSARAAEPQKALDRT